VPPSRKRRSRRGDALCRDAQHTDGTGADDTRADDGAHDDPEAAARQICLRLLTATPRTRAQLATALRRRGIPDDAAESVLSRFTDVGLIDDALFARAWVESRHHGRGLARWALAAELRQRGVAADDVRDAVDTLDPDEEAATARRLVDRKLAATRGQPPVARTRRLVATLARKGYPAPLAFRVVREALDAEGIDAAAAGLEDAEAGADPAGTAPGEI
jgi:regulatory protein